MENKQEQSRERKLETEKNDRKAEKLEGLPMEESPYLQYKDLEDYKKKGYGTEGHLEPKPGRGAGASTDAPTLSGGSITAQAEAQASATDTINRHGVP
ncbi:Late embryogenesis abundant protein [Parasponia andersonii]|uniref:Late embryogenesis abundant protein n=1 Tax=Parasponia andersonii TaxID=3476 RepID=A0A2P5D0A5_PARAD|nr:Late embryogenesis abundant protein [Parasponia andersonii]